MKHVNAEQAAHRRRTQKMLASVVAATVLVGIFIGAAQAGTGHAPVAVAAAHEVTLREKGSLHLVSHHSEVLQEQGSGTGTLNGRITVQLTLAYTHASVKFTAYTSGGTIVGSGEGTTFAAGPVAHFNGTANVTGGTGKYAHASAHAIKLKGTLVKKTYSLTVEVEGKMRY
jgi:hypothetical protein